MRQIIAFLLFVMAVTTQADTNSGFDEICDLYGSYEYSGESVGELWFILGERVEQSVSDIPALQIYSALNVADPCSRYDVFQEVAEDQLSRGWRCEQMERLLNVARSENCSGQ